MLSQGKIVQTRIRQITVCREKLLVVQKYFIASRLSKALDSDTVYVILFIWHLIFILIFKSKQAKK